MSTKRPYHSATRAQQAKETQERILCAAEALFTKQGFAATTIAQIAKEAAVSAPTIYALYQSKKGILSHLLDNAFPQEDFLSLTKKAREEQEPRKHLKITAKIARKIYEAENALIGILGEKLTELSELEKEKEARRYHRLEETFSILLASHSLSSVYPQEQLKDLLWTFTGRDLYRLLVLERKWSADDYEAWLCTTLQSTLLETSPA